MLHIAALTSGKLVPSTRFRVQQYIEPLLELGIKVDEYSPLISKYASKPAWLRHMAARPTVPADRLWLVCKHTARVPGLIGSWLHQVTWLEREFIPGRLFLERFVKKPYVFDVDDAIWLRGPRGPQTASYLAARAEAVIVGNSYLAEWFSRYSKRIFIVPTAVDCDKLRPENENYDELHGAFYIGWIGTSSNLKYLEALQSPLKQFFLRHRESKLLVVADRPPKFDELDEKNVEYWQWSLDNEIQAFAKMTVGLMPLFDDDWARGKCSYKMLQYMSCGVPVIVSPVGMNNEVLAKGNVGLPAKEDNEWFDALTFFHRNRNAVAQFGSLGRKTVEQYYSVKSIAPKLAQIFSTIQDRRRYARSHDWLRLTY